ncbi:hypothetical protein TNCV_4967881 [Trichonephila clavipes]|nr:hypothetical protein TNCV_4967881 [Trichonephila clavipes]
MTRIWLYDKCILKTPSHQVVEYCASIPQVRRSILGLGKIDSAFHPFRRSINEYQGSLGTKQWELRFRMTTWTWFKTTWSVAKSPGVAEQFDVNIHSLTRPLTQTGHLIGTSAHEPQCPKVTYTEMGTVGLGPHGLLHH